MDTSMITDEQITDLMGRLQRSWLNVGGKDGAPGVYMMYTRERSDQRLRWRGYNLPASMWERAEPASVLRFFAATMRDDPVLQAGTAALLDFDHFVGVAFACGAWGLMMHENPDSPAFIARSDQADAYARDRRINEHPDRQELVTVYTVTRDGRQGMGGWPANEPIDDRWNATIFHPDRHGEDIRGNIADALAILMEAFTKAEALKGQL